MQAHKTASERSDYALGQIAVLTTVVRMLVRHADPVVHAALQATDNEFLQQRIAHLSSMSKPYQEGVRDALKVLSADDGDS